MFSSIVSMTRDAVRLPSARSAASDCARAWRTSGGISVSARMYRSRAVVSMRSYSVFMSRGASGFRRSESRQSDRLEADIQAIARGGERDVLEPSGVGGRPIGAKVCATALRSDERTLCHHLTDSGEVDQVERRVPRGVGCRRAGDADAASAAFDL